MSAKQEYVRSDLDQQSLEDRERQALESQVTLVPSSAGYFSLFRYSTSIDRAVFVGSLASCVAAGAATPLMMVR